MADICSLMSLLGKIMSVSRWLNSMPISPLKVYSLLTDPSLVWQDTNDGTSAQSNYWASAKYRKTS